MMILRINDGNIVTINSIEYKVVGTSLENVESSGVSNNVSFDLRAAYGVDTPDIEVSFNHWTHGISERDLAGFVAMLTRG